MAPLLLLFIALSLLPLSHSSSDEFSILKQTDGTEVEWQNPIVEAEEILRHKYNSWLLRHERSYNTVGEKERRFSIFKDNMRYIEAHNAKSNQTYWLGPTRFADMTNEEFRRLHLGLRSGGALERKQRANGEETGGVGNAEPGALPDSIDWREFGAVAPVKNQGSCGELLFLSFL